MAREISVQFSNLDIKTQRILRNSIERILKENDPDLSAEELEATVDEVIADPLLEIEDQIGEESNMVIMSAAILQACDMIQKVLNKFEISGTSMSEVAKVAVTLDFDGL